MLLTQALHQPWLFICSRYLLRFSGKPERAAVPTAHREAVRWLALEVASKTVSSARRFARAERHRRRPRQADVQAQVRTNNALFVYTKKVRCVCIYCCCYCDVRPSPDKVQVRRVVPSGEGGVHAQRTRTVNATSERRLEVLRNCVSLIFDNKISDVRKVHAPIRSAQNFISVKCKSSTRFRWNRPILTSAAVNRRVIIAHQNNSPKAFSTPA